MIPPGVRRSRPTEGVVRVPHAAFGRLSGSRFFGATGIYLAAEWFQRAAEQGLDYETWKTRVLEDSPLRSIAQPIDIAYLALFLAGDESRMITGQSINCDAGGYMVG